MLAIIRLMLAIRNRPRIDIIAEKVGGPRNGRLDLGMLHASLFSQHDRELGSQSGLIYRTVPAHQTMRAAGLPTAGRRDTRETMAGRTEHA